ncbi:DEAD-box ATP-dependent RNA helicase 39-like isoform X1 [Carica papaya]|uniref:DEAD-box ATP-dependent RNA helicase 39-like isoform X1 n=1 Tax=Carica papaya TaxID=3649 RepID=UPI000B8C86A2|nr:DEAD-box ATP-dependent RNA helicase 39-like isoform X1 [Carica papaya]
MKGISKPLFTTLSLTSKLLSTSKLSKPTKLLPSLTAPFSSAARPGIKDPETPPTPNKRDSLILEQFKLRKLKGTVNADPQSKRRTPVSTPSSTGFEKAGGCSDVVLESENCRPAKVVSSFQELGLREEIIDGLKEMGIWVPSEIQCVGIPAVLDGKSVVLSSESGSGKTLAYLLPLLQLLRQDEAIVSMRPKHPRAIVLCTTEELSDEGFRVAKFISDYAKLKSTKKNDNDKSKDPEYLLNAPIGMLIGTPSEILQHIEEGNVVCDDIKYLVLDEADAMLSHGFHRETRKILNSLRDHGRLQTVLVTSTTAEILRKEVSPVMERLEHNHAGKVSAILLEVDQKEAFDLLESQDSLNKKVAEAMDSLYADELGS